MLPDILEMQELSKIEDLNFAANKILLDAKAKDRESILGSVDELLKEVASLIYVRAEQKEHQINFQVGPTISINDPNYDNFRDLWYRLERKILDAHYKVQIFARCSGMGMKFLIYVSW